MAGIAEKVYVCCNYKYKGVNLYIISSFIVLIYNNNRG